MSADHYYTPTKYRIVEEAYTETMLDGSVVRGISRRKVPVETPPADPAPPAKAP